jgi:AAA family ATP:ADP antiporter
MPDSSESFTAKLLRPFAQLRPGEATTALLMFAYSFLAMTSYNIIQPITRSKFISDLGAENIPYVQFVSGLLIGVIMQGYARATSMIPRRWVIPASQALLTGVLVAFWVLFQTGQEWVSAAFYLLGQIFAILLISQFWTLANAIYDPRQAKRIFGFIGGGSVLGGMTGAGITALIAERIGTNTLLLWSAVVLGACIGIVVYVLRRESQAVVSGSGVEEEQGLKAREALALFLKSRQIQLIAVIIGFGAIGAVILDQQLNMATQEFKGRGQEDSITSFLGQVRFYLSAAGLVIQVFLTSRIHRLLGIGFALMVLPIGLGTMAGVILANPALWAPAMGSVIDRSFRYTVDKTTREILFLPLPTDIKLQVKPFIDVTVDRLSKGIGALMLLVLIQPWGLGLTWQQLSFVTLILVALWFFMAVRAKREYVAAFRRSIEQQDVKAADIRLDTADLNTIEALVAELSHPEPRRVVYAIDLLQSLDKRHLVTPLLLHHESPQVRARALAVAEGAGRERASHWARGIEAALRDSDGEVRLAAVRALAALRGEDAAETVRPFLNDPSPELAVTAACALANSPVDADRAAAEAVLQRLGSDTRMQATPARLEVARALGQVQNPRFRPLLVPLMFDPDLSVARAAIQSARRLPTTDFLFVPPLVSLMRNRLLKPAAREVLVSYGDDVVDTLAYFLRDTDEDIWIRRHVPSTLALIPTQRSLDVLLTALEDGDGFVRFKAGAAIERVLRDSPSLKLDRGAIERQVLQEALRAFNALTLHHNLFRSGGLDPTLLLARALEQKYERAINRIFRLLGLLHSSGDIGAVRQALRAPDARLRSGALEYLDNLLAGDVRKRVMLLLEEMPVTERVKRGNTIFRTRVREVEDTVAQLVHDEDQVLAALAMQLVERRQMWSLAPDLEHALEHRDPRHWYVFEEASWVLAASRMPTERRRASWLEPLPAPELADRIRTIQLFKFASVDELFRIADLGKQVRHEAGSTLYSEGHPPESLQFLLDGTVTSSSGGSSVDIAAPAPLAFEAVLEGSPMKVTIRATETAISLSLTTEEFLSLLSENVEIAQGLFRMLIEAGGGQSEWRSVLHGRLSSSVGSRVAAGLQALDRIVILQSSPLLARATAEQLLGLASIARDVTLTPGENPLSGDEASILVVLTGTLRVQSGSGETDTAGPGDTLGIYETLGGVPLTSQVEVVERGAGLRFVRSDLFDVLADNVDLMQGIFSGLLRARPDVRTK